MEKKKRITLNAEKRKVISDVFQDHFEKNSTCNCMVQFRMILK